MSGDELLALLEKALADAGSTHSVQHVMTAVERGHAQMIGNPNGMVVTEVIEYPNFPAVRVWLAAGEMDAVLALSPQVERFAREIGARRIEAIGRHGWVRVSQQYGWRPAGIGIIKDLAH